MTYITNGPTIQGLTQEEINNGVWIGHQLNNITNKSLIDTASGSVSVSDFNTVVNRLNDIISKLTVV
jgi:hypothetical protein